MNNINGISIREGPFFRKKEKFSRFLFSFGSEYQIEFLIMIKQFRVDVEEGKKHRNSRPHEILVLFAIEIDI